MSAETKQLEMNQDANAALNDTIRKFAVMALDQLNEGIDSLHRLQAEVDRGTFDNDTGGRIERAVRLAEAATENLSPWANDTRPTKPR